MRTLSLGTFVRLNILVGKDGKIRLIDFDWCGVHERDKYPFINGIDWARGVGPMATNMNKSHDLYLLQNLETHLHAGDVPGTLLDFMLMYPFPIPHSGLSFFHLAASPTSFSEFSWAGLRFPHIH